MSAIDIFCTVIGGILILVTAGFVGFLIGERLGKKEIIEDMLEKGFWKEKNLKIEGKIFLEKE